MKEKTKNVCSYVFPIIIGLSVVAVVGLYIYERVNSLEIPEEQVKGSVKTEEEIIEEEIVEENEPEENIQIYNETPAYDGALFFESLPVIDGQQAYISHPLSIDLDNPPTVIIYSHGSITTVTANMEDQMMVDLRLYGEYFTEKGYVFAASNQHGASWGDNLSVTDTQNLVDWINENYIIQQDVNLLGYSMGGLPTLNYATKYPENLNKIALLAPTSYYSEWDLTRFEGIQYTPVGIWHGDLDVNVPWNLSNDLVTKANSFSMTNWTLNTVEGATHWDVDTELMEEIYEFYNN